MLILPAWLWLALFAIALVTAVTSWAKKILIDNPRSARAVARGAAIANARLERSCRSAILNHELTMPGQTEFVAFLQPLEYIGASGRAKTPIILGLSEHTLGVTHKTGYLGNTLIILINRKDIKTGQTVAMRGEVSYSIETTETRILTFRLESESDRKVLESWVQFSQKNAVKPAS